MAENLAVIEEGYAALNAEDLPRWLATFSEDAELHELASIPDAAIHRGHEGLRSWFESGTEVFEAFRFDPEEVKGVGQSVLVRVHVHGRGRAGGAPVETTVFHLFELRDGKVWRVRGYLNEDEALKATGRSEQK